VMLRSMRPNRMNDESLMGHGPQQKDVRLRFPARRVVRAAQRSVDRATFLPLLGGGVFPGRNSSSLAQAR
jgi:hypothetical protein